MWTIYKYIKKNNNKVVYVGQTNNIKERCKKHEQYDPFNKKSPEYNYPLSRGIRKYGINNYVCEIIEENIPTKQEAISKEEYWIKYYDTYNNGYNQTPGGIAPVYIKFSPEIIELAKKEIKQRIPFNIISEHTGISIAHLSEINTGKRHYDSTEKYPLNSMTRGRKITDEQVERIVDLLKNTAKSQKVISEEVGCNPSTVSDINRGKFKNCRETQYPIRQLRRKNTK